MGNVLTVIGGELFFTGCASVASLGNSDVVTGDVLLVAATGAFFGTSLPTDGILLDHTGYDA